MHWNRDSQPVSATAEEVSVGLLGVREEAPKIKITYYKGVILRLLRTTCLLDLTVARVSYCLLIIMEPLGIYYYELDLHGSLKECGQKLGVDGRKNI